jgi:cell division cycle 2-like
MHLSTHNHEDDVEFEKKNPCIVVSVHRTIKRQRAYSMNNPKKRDRWASSSEDDEDDEKTKQGTVRHPPNVPQQESSSNSECTPKDLANGKSNTSNDKDNNRSKNVNYYNPLLSGCRLVHTTYERLERISEGTYGIVWKARSLLSVDNNTIMALKQMKFPSNDNESVMMPSAIKSVWKDGFPIMALREINALLALRKHENIVSLHEIVVGDHYSTIPPKIFMVMDYYQCDLKVAIQKYTTEVIGGPLLQAELMGIVQQILEGVRHIHQHKYLHRDLKPSNILVKQLIQNGRNTSRLAIADFGLARKYKLGANMTLPVATLWYRAPELLFGQAQYTYAVDLWSIGCIMGELIRSPGNFIDVSAASDDPNCEDDDEEYNNSTAIVKGKGELDQIDAIFQLLGVPNEETWPSFQTLPNAKLLRWKQIPNDEIMFPKLFPTMDGSNGNTSTIALSNQTFLDKNGHELLRKLLELDPEKRIDAEHALQHAYFTDGVRPQIPDFNFR